MTKRGHQFMKYGIAVMLFQVLIMTMHHTVLQSVSLQYERGKMSAQVHVILFGVDAFEAQRTIHNRQVRSAVSAISEYLS